MPEPSSYGYMAEGRAEAAAGRTGEEHHVDALGEGLAAIALALLDVADAIRAHTDVVQYQNE